MNELRKDILENYCSIAKLGKPAKYFAEKYGIGIGRVQCLASELKVTWKYKLQQQAPNIINDYKNGLSINEIQKKYGHGDKFLKQVLTQNGIVLKSQSEWNKRYSMNDSYFKKVDTHEKAYWLGFLYADGNLSQEGVQLALSEKDKYHLETFLKCIESNHPLYKDRNSFRFFIKRYDFYEDLLKLGMTERKSLTLLPPTEDVISQEFISSFILGYFDGDGSINIGTKRKTWGINIIGTMEICKWIRSFLSQLGIGNGCLYREKRCENNKNVWYVTYGGGFATKRGQKKLKPLYDFLYKKSPISLKRKKDRFEYVLSYPSLEKSVRKKRI